MSRTDPTFLKQMREDELLAKREYMIGRINRGQMVHRVAVIHHQIASLNGKGCNCMCCRADRAS